MVSKITIFEPHFDGARFGPAMVEGDDETETPATEAAEASRTRSPLPGLLALVGIVVAIGLLARRRGRSRDAARVDIEVTEGETAEVTR